MNKKKKENILKNERLMERVKLFSNILATIKEETNREGLKDTPLRVAAMYDELFYGYKQNGKEILNDALFEDENCEDMVIIKNIPFYSMCEHHIMPFFGNVNVGYIPQDGRIVGISKIARLVDVYAKRLQVQERLGKQILSDIKAVMNPKGIIVNIEAEHTCMTARGVQKMGTKTVTAAVDGVFYTDEKARKEFYMNVNR